MHGMIKVMLLIAAVVAANLATQARAHGLDSDEILRGLDFTAPAGDAPTGDIHAWKSYVESHFDEAPMIEDAMHSIAVQLRDDKLKDPFRLAGGIELIRDVMSHHEDARILALACGALWDLALNNAANRHHIMNAGVVPLILEAMDKHPDIPGMVTEASGALLNLASSPEFRDYVRGVGGVEAVLAGMDRHYKDYFVQQEGCGAIINFCSGNAANRQAVLDADGVRIIVQAIHEHPEQPRPQERCIGALANLGEDPRAKVEVLEVDGIEAVLESMARLPGEKTVIQYGLAALSSLAVGSDPTKDHIKGSGGIDTLVKMVSDFDDEEIATAVLGAIWATTTGHDTNLEYAREAGAIHAICSAMKRFPDSSAVQERAAVALWSHATNSDGRKVMKKAGANKLLRKAKKKNFRYAAEVLDIVKSG